jgi:hypothetical protein
MKTMIQSMTMSMAVLGAIAFAIPVHAETTATEKVQEGAEDAAKNVKKAGRAMKDKACEMVNGKLECVGKKAANKMRNLKDEVEDKANDVKKKVD